MFGLGFGEILLLAAIGLIVLGPKQMPQVARVIGRTIAEIKKALGEVTSQVRVDLTEDDKRDTPKKEPAPIEGAPRTPFDDQSHVAVDPDKKEKS